MSKINWPRGRLRKEEEKWVSHIPRRERNKDETLRENEDQRGEIKRNCFGKNGEKDGKYEEGRDEREAEREEEEEE